MIIDRYRVPSTYTLIHKYRVVSNYRLRFRCATCLRPELMHSHKQNWKICGAIKEKTRRRDSWNWAKTVRGSIITQYPHLRSHVSEEIKERVKVKEYVIKCITYQITAMSPSNGNVNGRRMENNDNPNGNYHETSDTAEQANGKRIRDMRSMHYTASHHMIGYHLYHPLKLRTNQNHAC